MRRIPGNRSTKAAIVSALAITGVLGGGPAALAATAPHWGVHPTPSTRGVHFSATPIIIHLRSTAPVQVSAEKYVRIPGTDRWRLVFRG